MSISVMSQVWKSSQHSGSELLLLLAIADNANDEGVAWPSIATLATKTRMSERQTMRLVKKLESSDELEVERRLNTTSVYRIRGDKMSPVSQPQMSGGGDVTMSSRSDKAMAHEPSISINEPSLPAGKVALKVVEDKRQLSSWIGDIYKAYPKHKARGAAEKAIASALRRVSEGETGEPVSMPVAFGFLLTRANEYRKEREGENAQFTPYPATWFNAKSYLDLDGKPPAPVEQTNETQSTNKNAAELTRQQLSGGRR